MDDLAALRAEKHARYAAQREREAAAEAEARAAAEAAAREAGRGKRAGGRKRAAPPRAPAGGASRKRAPRPKGRVLGSALAAGGAAAGAVGVGMGVGAAADASTAGVAASASPAAGAHDHERAAASAAADFMRSSGAGENALAQSLGRSGGAVDNAKGCLGVAMVQAAAGGGGGSGGALIDALRKDFRAALDLRARQEEGLLKVAAARAGAAAFSSLPDGRLAVRYTAGDRSCASGAGRAASGARGEVVADLPAQLLPLLLKALVGDAAQSEAVRGHLQPESMAVVCPRVFWAIVRHGGVGSEGQTFDGALRALCPDFDWDGAAVGQRLSQRPDRYEGYVIGDAAQRAGSDEEAEVKRRKKRAPRGSKSSPKSSQKAGKGEADAAASEGGEGHAPSGEVSAARDATKPAGAGDAAGLL